jgi:hypothetical protein
MVGEGDTCKNVTARQHHGGDGGRGRGGGGDEDRFTQQEHMLRVYSTHRAKADFALSDEKRK